MKPLDDFQRPAGTGRASIVIARHGQPALDRTKGPRLTWREYVDWWARYEKGALKEGQEPPSHLVETVGTTKILLTSERLRAQQTLQAAVPGGGTVKQLALFNEAPLPPPTLPLVRFLPKTWNVIARIAWLLGHSLGGETYVEARARAGKAADLLDELSQGGPVFLAAHGWFNRMIRTKLKRLGWICVEDQGDRYWGFRRYEYRPPQP